MNEVRAFVGHSFTSDDSAVVSAFLAYFDQISGLYPAFTWAHATASEPVDLRDKVLSIIEGKNAFIGICTRKERVAVDGDFESALFLKDKLKISREKLKWKTSDWVIQEIGLAIGRQMAVILLVEDGVRPPGGLQGNIEYLTFSRTAPEATFGKLLEMIRALSPPIAGSAGSLPDQTAPEASQNAPQREVSNKNESVDQPTPDWTRADYHRAHFFRLIDDDEPGAEEISAAYLSSGGASDAEGRGVWEAETEWTKIVLNKGGSLPRLRQLAVEFPQSADVLGYLGYALAFYGEPIEAADHHDAAAAAAPDTPTIVTFLCAAAVERTRGGRLDLGMATLERAKEFGCGNTEVRIKLLKAIQEIAEIQKDSSLKLDAMEGIIDLSPEDITIRFLAAYEHSQLGNDDLALKHYLSIPSSNRTSMTWNNLGVAYNEFGMPGKSVDCYRQAASLGESLAMSNIAYKFMESGFFSESEVEFKKALAVEDFHKNVGQGISALRSAPERENEKESEVLAVAAEKAVFYRALGQAVVSKTISLSGEWKGPSCALVLTVVDGKFSAYGEYEPKNALSQLRSNASTASRYTIEYKGTVIGRRVQGTVTRISSDQPRVVSLLAATDNSNDFLMFISDDEAMMEVAENPRSKRPTFYRITAVR